jgi:hypothetical protein
LGDSNEEYGWRFLEFKAWENIKVAEDFKGKISSKLSIL